MQVEKIPLNGIMPIPGGLKGATPHQIAVTLARCRKAKMRGHTCLALKVSKHTAFFSHWLCSALPACPRDCIAHAEENPLRNLSATGSRTSYVSTHVMAHSHVAPAYVAAPCANRAMRFDAVVLQVYLKTCRTQHGAATLSCKPKTGHHTKGLATACISKKCASRLG